LEGTARMRGEPFGDARGRRQILGGAIAFKKIFGGAFGKVGADELFVAVEEGSDGGADDVGELKIGEIDFIRSPQSERTFADLAVNGRCLVRRRCRCDRGGLSARQQFFLAEDNHFVGGVCADECSHSFDHGAFAFHDFLTGDGQNAPLIA